MATTKRFILVFLCLPLILAGCKATTPTTVHAGPDAVFLAPAYPTLKLESLAYLGVATMVPDPVGVPTVDQLLRSYLQGGQQKFLIIDETSARSRASKSGAVATLDKAIRAWKDQHTVDPFILKDLGEKLGMDGFVFGDLTHWREETVDWTSEGNSFTEVGVAISIYDAKTGILAWKGEKMERRESQHYRHGSGVGTGVYNSGGIERTERGDKIVPPPPKPDEVAETVVQQLIEGLPDRPAAKPAQTAP
jgi:hypothetical protein